MTSRRAAFARVTRRMASLVRPHRPLARRALLWAAMLGLPLLTVWTVALNVAGKGTLDIYPLFMLVWLGASLWAVRRVRAARAFVVAAAVLLLLDTLADILAMGSWLRGPWAALSQAGFALVGRALVVEWRWDLGVDQQVATYWAVFWGAAVPIRTGAMLFGVVLRSRRLGGWAWAPICLAAGTFALYAGHVEDVLYFALLGYLPFTTRTPLDYSYLPPTLGFSWNTAAVNTVALAALLVAGVLFEVAIRRSEQ